MTNLFQCAHVRLLVTETVLFCFAYRPRLYITMVQFCASVFFMSVLINENRHGNGYTRGGIEENEADYAGHYTSRPKTPHLDPAADSSDIYHSIRYHQKVETLMGKTRRQTTRQQVGHQSNGLVTPRMDKMTRETKSEMERRSRSPFGTRMAKSGPKQMPVEAIQGGVPP